MIGFRFINLLVPGDPARFTINGGSGSWQFEQEANFGAAKDAVVGNMCAETYTGEHPVSLDDGAAGCDTAFDELLPLCLGASYLTGRSVTVRRSLPHSDVMLAQVGSHFPRERSINGTRSVVTSGAEFQAAIEAFLTAYTGVGHTEKVLLLIHHWLDALSCWALEDFYLSGTTILQIVAATEESRCPITHNPSFYKYLTAAANRHGLPALSHDVIEMRNDLVHDGSLSGSRFQNKNVQDCGVVAAEVLNWIDIYLHTALHLGPVRQVRFDANLLATLNAYSL